MSKTPATVAHRSGSGFLLLALFLTGGFYATAPFTPGIQSFVRRYFCSHPLEVLTTTLFFTGLALLAGKLARLRRERGAVSCAVSEAFAGKSSLAERMTPQQLQKWCDDQPACYQSTFLVERLRATAEYVGARGCDGLESHLKYLAELASDRLHQSFAIIRTITWAIPILGFLGTVIGITMAIANLTPEQLDTSLPMVVAGLEAAFDTTALALGLSIGLVFASFTVERFDQVVLNAVEQFGISHTLSWFAADSGAQPGLVPLGDDWAEQCAALRRAWSETLNRHFEKLAERLDTDVEGTMATHRDAARSARTVWSEALEAASSGLATALSGKLDVFAERVERWQDALEASSRFAAEQSESLHGLGRTLLRLAESEERLAALQRQLNSNLQAVQTVETLEQAVSSLAAAVNVLTIKTGKRSAA